MKADDFIKQVIEEDVETLELSDDIFNKIIGNMDMNEEHWWENLKLFTMMKKIISNLHIIDIIEVAVFVFVLIFVPFGVTHYNVHIREVQNVKNTNSDNNKKMNSAIFLDKIRQIVNGQHSSIIDQANMFKNSKQETYTNLNEIKQKTPFQIEYPSYIPDEYKLDNTILKLAINGPFQFAEYYKVIISYKNKENKIITIAETNPKDEVSDVIKNSVKISIGGINAAIRDKQTSDSNSNLVFWLKDKTYTIFSSNDNYRDELVKIAKSFKGVADSSFWSNEEYELYTDMNIIKEKVPYEIQSPKFLSDGYKLLNYQLNVTKRSSDSFYKTYLGYGDTTNGGGFTVTIANEASKPEDILNKCQKVTLGNLESWIYPCEDSSNHNQIMFWKKGIYYNICSGTLDINTLKEIAKSYDDSYKAGISQEHAIDNVIDLKQMNLTLPSNWKKQGNENELFFANENNQIVGGISLVGFYDENHYPVPNHSEIVNTEDIEVRLGKGKLFTLLRDNPPASGNTKTWNELHAIIPTNKNNLAYDIWIEGTNKDTLLSILKSIN